MGWDDLENEAAYKEAEDRNKNACEVSSAGLL